jgi:hypothetical protein
MNEEGVDIIRITGVNFNPRTKTIEIPDNETE